MTDLRLLVLDDDELRLVEEAVEILAIDRAFRDHRDYRALKRLRERVAELLVR